MRARGVDRAAGRVLWLVGWLFMWEFGGKENPVGKILEENGRAGQAEVR